jgi:hypothetical protein
VYRAESRLERKLPPPRRMKAVAIARSSHSGNGPTLVLDLSKIFLLVDSTSEFRPRLRNGVEF